jgi:hypothetical protein
VESVTQTLNSRGDGTPSPIVLKGNQHIHKFNSTVQDTTRILLAVFRVETKDIDLVLSMNIPLQTVEGDTDDTQNRQAQLDFKTAVESLHIVDFDLFV